MKTLTELSGILVRKAAAAIAEAEKSLPKPKAPAAAEPPPPAPADAAEAREAPVEPEGAAPKAAAEEAEGAEAKAALDGAVATATGLSGDRLSRLRDAVKAAGGRIDDVRLVRVFGPEEPVTGATLLNGFQYLVDLAPASMRQDGAPPKKERFGRGERRGGGGKGAPASGGFSMDSLKDDRKGQRGGPRGRGKPGGGTPR